MKTLKKLTILTATLLITSIVFGQQSKGKRPSKERIKSMKVGYITEKLNLSSEEAQKFWPIYNEFSAKADELRSKVRKMHKRETTIDEMTDSEVEKMVDARSNVKQQELDLHKEYHSKFKAVLPIKKVAKLYKADHDFKRDLLKRIKNHKGGGSGSSGDYHQRKKRVRTDF